MKLTRLLANFGRPSNRTPDAAPMMEGMEGRLLMAADGTSNTIMHAQAAPASSSNVFAVWVTVGFFSSGEKSVSGR